MAGDILPGGDMEPEDEVPEGEGEGEDYDEDNFFGQ